MPCYSCGMECFYLRDFGTLVKRDFGTLLKRIQKPLVCGNKENITSTGLRALARLPCTMYILMEEMKLNYDETDYFIWYPKIREALMNCLTLGIGAATM